MPEEQGWKWSPRYYTKEDAARDFAALRGEEIARYVKVYRNVSHFVEEAYSSMDAVREKLGGVVGLPTGGGVVVVDPTGRFLSLLRVDVLGRRMGEPEAVLMSMSPPIIPHFFLSAAYVVAGAGLTPVVLLKLSPVVGLAVILGKIDGVEMPAANFVISSSLIDLIATHEVSVVPFPHGVLRLPTRPRKRDTLYLCDLGLSTEPLGGSYSVEVSFADVPPLGEDVLRSSGFVPLREALATVVRLHE